MIEFIRVVPKVVPGQMAHCAREFRSFSAATAQVQAMAAPEPAVAREYNAMKNKFNTIAAKINELEAERNEHALVVASMEKLEAGRRCFRLVSGVLVERTVGEVLPAVRKNLEGVRRPIPAVAHPPSLTPRSWRAC